MIEDKEGSFGYETQDLDKIERWKREYEERDEECRLRVRDNLSFKISILETTTLGPFIVFNDVEVPARFIESIKLGSLGKPPQYYVVGHPFLLGGTYAHLPPLVGSCRASAFPASWTSIKITTISGREYIVGINRHESDAALSALLEAWRSGR